MGLEPQQAELQRLRQENAKLREIIKDVLEHLERLIVRHAKAMLKKERARLLKKRASQGLIGH